MYIPGFIIKIQTWLDKYGLRLFSSKSDHFVHTVSHFFYKICGPIWLRFEFWVMLRQTPSQSAPTILKNRAPCFLKIGHPAFWKKQSAKNQGHCNSKREEAAWSLLFLNKEWPCFFQPAFCKKQGAPFFKKQGARFLRIVGDSFTYVSLLVTPIRINNSNVLSLQHQSVSTQMPSFVLVAAYSAIKAIPKSHYHRPYHYPSFEQDTVAPCVRTSH